MKCSSWEVMHISSTQNPLASTSLVAPSDLRRDQLYNLVMCPEGRKTGSSWWRTLIPNTMCVGFLNHHSKPLGCYQGPQFTYEEPEAREVKWLIQGHLQLDPKSSGFEMIGLCMIQREPVTERVEAEEEGCCIKVWVGPFITITRELVKMHIIGSTPEILILEVWNGARNRPQVILRWWLKSHN